MRRLGAGGTSGAESRCSRSSTFSQSCRDISENGAGGSRSSATRSSRRGQKVPSNSWCPRIWISTSASARRCHDWSHLPRVNRPAVPAPARRRQRRRREAARRTETENTRGPAPIVAPRAPAEDASRRAGCGAPSALDVPSASGRVPSSWAMTARTQSGDSVASNG